MSYKMHTSQALHSHPSPSLVKPPSSFVQMLTGASLLALYSAQPLKLYHVTLPFKAGPWLPSHSELQPPAILGPSIIRAQ